MKLVSFEMAGGTGFGAVGMKHTPTLFMKPGDVAEVEISGIGILRNPVAGED
ncbi:fumarylacetoacetate hydrolase family protein [Plastoroseomonas hellenica]|uniref:fumarylacetoacetate hydrolase family protein n=1 Tax=Plastoroseomonas hellenica TaxID=2687306 RepID=UPI001BAC8767|nr:fumarylacetoacetate hydrolase family protein [Plastoroseomonas hellenica]